MSNVYRNLILVTLQATVYDKIKHMYMPMSRSGYSDFSYYFRLFACAGCTMGLTAMITYPLDLINTRLASDMSKNGATRLYKTTFDCFNQTNISSATMKEGLYRGVELAVAGSAIRAMLTLPVYDLFRS